MIVKEVSQREKEKDDFEKLEELVSSESSEQETENQPDEGEIKPVSKRNLAPLFEQNPDCIGWIYIEGTTSKEETSTEEARNGATACRAVYT